MKKPKTRRVKKLATPRPANNSAKTKQLAKKAISGTISNIKKAAKDFAKNQEKLKSKVRATRSTRKFFGISDEGVKSKPLPISKARAAQTRAKKLVDEMQSKGFVVDPKLLEAVNRKLPAKMTQQEANQFADEIKSAKLKAAKFEATLMLSAGEPNGLPIVEGVLTDISYKDITSDKNLAKLVNKLTSTKMPVNNAKKAKEKGSSTYTEMRHIETLLEYDTLSTIIEALTGENPVAGMITEWFEIDQDYDEDNSPSLGQHIKFKKLPRDMEMYDGRTMAQYILDELGQLIYTDRNLFDKYKEKKARQAGERILNELGVDEQDRATLDELLNGNYIWAISQREAPPSDAAKMAYEHLTEIVVEAQHTAATILAEVVDMIKNGRDYSEIVLRFEEMITLFKDGQGNNIAG